MNRNLARSLVLSLAWLVLGCAEETIDRDVCGNGLVDSGEDCDADDGTCVDCSITCVATADCLAYDPEGAQGFVCGTDGRCHAPAGTFDTPHELAMPVSSLSITDVGGDAMGDVLVQSETSIAVVFGDPSGVGFDATSLVTPSPLGATAFGDLDGDLAEDVLLPTADGIVAYTTKNGAPSPFPFPQEIGTLGAPRYANPVRDDIVAAIGTVGSDPTLVLLVLDVKPVQPSVVGFGALCGATADAFDPESVDVFERSPGHQLLTLRLTPPTGPSFLCVIAIDELVTGDFSVKPIDVPNSNPPTSKAVLADVRKEQPADNPCPSLFVQQAGGNSGVLVEYPPGVPDPGTPCGFGAPRTVPSGELPPAATPIGAVPLKPAIGNVGLQALALTSGIYGMKPDLTLLELFRSDRALGAVRVADLDGDSDLDVVATGERATALDVLYRLTGAEDGYLPFRLATDSTVTTLQIGDYDGNSLLDIAYVERFQDEVTRERLMIAFGTQDQLLPGAVVGTFERVLSLVPTDVEDSVDRFGVISDLAVLFESSVGMLPGSKLTQLALLHGSPQRTMLAFFDPRGVRLGSTFRGVVPGHFGDDPAITDVLAIEQTDDGTNLWLTTGALGGSLSAPASPTGTSTIKPCGAAIEPGSSIEVFCLDEARFVAWPRPFGHDLVVGIDRKHGLAVIDPRELGVIDRIEGVLLAPEDTIASALRVVTAPDGTPHLLVSMGPTRQAESPDRATSVHLCTLEPGGPNVAPTASCVDLGARISELDGTPHTCSDGAYANLASARRFEPPDTLEPELVLLCRQQGATTSRVVRMPFALTRVVSVLELDRLADALAVGDVTGDAVPDLVIGDRFGTPNLAIYRQCTSRDSVCGELVVSNPSAGRRRP